MVKIYQGVRNLSREKWPGARGKILPGNGSPYQRKYPGFEGSILTGSLLSPRFWPTSDLQLKYSPAPIPLIWHLLTDERKTTTLAKLLEKLNAKVYDLEGPRWGRPPSQLSIERISLYNPILNLMPRRLKTPCSFPSCPELSDTRFCPTHTREDRKQYVGAMGTSGKRFDLFI